MEVLWGVISTVGAFFGNKQDQNYEDGHFGIEPEHEGAKSKCQSSHSKQQWE